MAKVLEIKMCIGTDQNINTNIIKATLSNLLTIGKTCSVVSAVLKPMPPQGAINKFLAEKTPWKFYHSEMILLCKEDKFATGVSINAVSIDKMLSDAIPALTDKKTGESMNLNIIGFKCTKL